MMKPFKPTELPLPTFPQRVSEQNSGKLKKSITDLSKAASALNDKIKKIVDPLSAKNKIDLSVNGFAQLDRFSPAEGSKRSAGLFRIVFKVSMYEGFLLCIERSCSRS